MGTFFWIAAVTVVVDQLSKVLAVLYLKPDPSGLVLIPGLLNLSYAENTGAAFSIMHGRVGLLTWVSLVISIGLVLWVKFLKPYEHGTRIWYGLILGGAIGNLIDRARLGYVIDFIDAYWQQYHWPTFNLADSAICVGIAVLMILSLLMPVPGETATVAPSKQAPSDNQSHSR